MTVAHKSSHEFGQLLHVAVERLVDVDELWLEADSAITALDQHSVVSDSVQKHGPLGVSHEGTVVAARDVVWDLFLVED